VHSDLPLEGWYTDPWERHEARWFSDGKPTNLVRDAGVEGDSPPPDDPPSAVPEEIEAPVWNLKGADLRRVGDDERSAAGYSERACDSLPAYVPSD
jgi:UDP:flavonoid glycosyltransferase YjiC (YdhE family)